MLTVINNLADPSGILQPRAVWDVRENVQFLAGATIYYGRNGTEYGGISHPDADVTLRYPDTAYLWVTWYF